MACGVKGEQTMSEYSETSSKLARDAEVTVPTVNLYAELGLLDFMRLSNGMRLYAAGQASRVRQIYTERMSNKGRRRLATA
jgi:DNA-binding transcriptional MerR regulator